MDDSIYFIESQGKPGREGIKKKGKRERERERKRERERDREREREREREIVHHHRRLLLLLLLVPSLYLGGVGRDAEHRVQVGRGRRVGMPAQEHARRGHAAPRGAKRLLHRRLEATTTTKQTKK